jgi:hypothetical protein
VRREPFCGIALALSIASLGATSRPTSQPGATSRPTTLPTTHAIVGPSGAELRAWVREATGALNEEFEFSLRDPANHPLRPGSNYFLDHPATQLTPDVIVQAIGFKTGNPRQTAYVRWQLLSALPPKLDDATAQALLNAYRSAPLPILRPGMSRQDQLRMDRLAQRAREADEPDIRRQLEQAITAIEHGNAPILAYRDELYHRLPKDARTFAAALDDLLERCNAAADGKELIKALSKDMRAWMSMTSDPPSVLARLAEGTRRLADTRGPQYYQTLYWSDYTRHFSWRKTRSRIDSGHTLKDLAEALEEQSRRPPLNLDIKAPAPSGVGKKK